MSDERRLYETLISRSKCIRLPFQGVHPSTSKVFLLKIFWHHKERQGCIKTLLWSVVWPEHNINLKSFFSINFMAKLCQDHMQGVKRSRTHIDWSLWKDPPAHHCGGCLREGSHQRCTRARDQHNEEQGTPYTLTVEVQGNPGTNRKARNPWTLTVEEEHPRPLVRHTGGHLDQWSPGMFWHFSKYLKRS